MCVQTTVSFWNRWQPDLHGGADKRWAWLVQIIRVSGTACYSAKKEEVAGINSLWLKKLPRLLQWIKWQNVAERAGNTLSLSVPHNEKQLMADLSSIFGWICFEHFCVSKIVKLKILDFRLVTGIMEVITLCRRTLNVTTDWVTDMCASCAWEFEWAKNHSAKCIEPTIKHSLLKGSLF